MRKERKEKGTTLGYVIVTVDAEGDAEVDKDDFTYALEEKASAISARGSHQYVAALVVVSD